MKTNKLVFDLNGVPEDSECSCAQGKGRIHWHDHSETKTTHTPGPWEVTVHVDASNFTTYMINEELTAGSEDEKEAEANARLIAAAPELLDILKAIAEQFNEGADKVYKDALWPKDDEKTLGQWINEAIAATH